MAEEETKVSGQRKACMAAFALGLAAAAGAASASTDQSSTAQAAPQKWSVGDRFRDCAACPEMMVVPAGRFAMGSRQWEELYADEGPVHPVTIATPFAVGVHEVTVAEFERFVNETAHATGHSCWTRENHEQKSRLGRGWRNPGFPQEASHPVVCVNWHDARRYAAWLAEETGEPYRLPSESEWEYVARAGKARVWEHEVDQCAYANGSDASANQFIPWQAAPCNDGYAHTAPVGSFPPNAWGLHDLLGNASEWTQDCWNESYAGAPADGRPWESGECGQRVFRGGAYSFVRSALRLARRDATNSGNRGDVYGFRVVRTLGP